MTEREPSNINEKNKGEKFVRPDDPILVRVAEEINPSDITSSENQEIIEKMLDIGYGEQTDRNKPILVGLAAPQIGISKRIILVDVASEGTGKIGDLRVYVNPEIIWKSREEDEWYEGCFSTDIVRGIVSRPNKIRIKSYTREGNLIEEEHQRYIARIFQHEIDHLNGIEFTNHITDDNKLHWVEDEEMPEYRDKEKWRNWPKKCPREKWEQIKRIKK
jgi:peptide deformylase